MRLVLFLRRSRRSRVVAAVTVALLAVGVSNVWATISPSVFEGDDANLVATSSSVDDWCLDTNAAAACANEFPGLSKGFDIPDPAAAANPNGDNSFGGGTKQDSECPGLDFGSIPPNKDDLTRLYVATEKISNQDFLYLAWERNNEGGSAHMGFEFNQSSTLCSNGTTVLRSPGDLLIVYDFGGSGAPELAFLKWLTEDAGDSEADCEASGDLPCWGERTNLGSSVAKGAVNAGTISDPINPSAPRSLTASKFGEAEINLTLAGALDPTICQTFGKASLISRSAGSSFKAQMKDFIAPIPVNITNCGSVKIVKTGGASGSQAAGPLNNATFTLTGPSPDTTVYTCVTGVSNSDGSVPAAGECSFINVPIGTYSLDETVVPAGYNKAPGLPNNNVVVSGGTQTINLTDPALPGRVNITKTDDDSPANPLNGAVFTLTAQFSGGPTLTCTTGVANSDGSVPAAGACSFISVPLGTYSLDETTVPAGHTKAPGLPQNVVVGLGGTTGQGQTINLGPFENKREFKIIVLVCKESDNSLYSTPITIDGSSAGNSIAAAPAGTTAAALCGINSGAAGDKHFGNHNATANIPQ